MPSRFKFQFVLAGLLAFQSTTLFAEDIKEFRESQDCPIAKPLMIEKVEKVAGGKSFTLAKPEMLNLNPDESLVLDFSSAPIERLQIHLAEKISQPIQIDVEWRATPGGYDWGIKKGRLVLKPDSSGCFGTEWVFPANTPTNRLVLKALSPVKGLTVRISDKVWDKDAKLCPKKEVFDKIEDKFAEVQKQPTNEKLMGEFTQSLTQILPSYDCRRSQDTSPVPAWWLHDREAERWFNFVYSSDLDSAYRFISSKEFLKTLDGAYLDTYKPQFMKERREGTKRVEKLLKKNPPIAGLLVPDGAKVVFGFIKDEKAWTHFAQRFTAHDMNWYVIFDGASREKLDLSNNQKIIGGADSSPEFRWAQTKLEVELKTPYRGLQKVRDQSNAVFSHRPLLIANRKVSDPNKWKPVPLIPSDIIETVRKKAIESGIIYQVCHRSGVHASDKIKDPSVLRKITIASEPGTNLNFKNADGEYLVQVALPAWKEAETGADCTAQADFGKRLAFYVKADQKIKFLGGDVSMIDAADLDSDGVSELVLTGKFNVAEPDTEYPMRGAILLSTKTMSGPVLQ